VIPDSVNCSQIFLLVLVDYHKPGEALARVVSEAASKDPQLKVIFLKNHGLVIGGTMW